MSTSTALGIAELAIRATTSMTEPPALLRRERRRNVAAEFVNDLLKEAWESEPWLLRRGWPEPATLFSRERFEALVLADRGNAARTSLIAEGVARPLATDEPAERMDIVARLYADGCSLLSTRIEERVAQVAALCRDIDLAILRGGMALSVATSANAYLGPSGARGFPLHYDDHCALVIQLNGSKHWIVHSPAERLPITRCEHPVAAAALGHACLEVTLAAGDMLYVPRGFPHAARAGSGGSLHITLALRTLTWGALADHEGGDGAAWRGSARLCGDRPGVPRIHHAESLLAARIACSLSALAPLPGGRFAAIDALDALCPDSQLAHAPHIMVLHRDEEAEALLHYPGGVLRLPRMMSPVFAFVAAHERFALGDLPRCAGDYDRIELVSALVRRGLLVSAASA